MALCLLLKRDYKNALTKLDYILDTIAKKYADQIWLLRGVVNSVLGFDNIAEKDFRRAYKYDRTLTEQFLDQKQDVRLNIFPQQQRLCSYFQAIKVDLPGFSRSGGASIYLKPSFSFPFIKPPNMIPCVD